MSSRFQDRNRQHLRRRLSRPNADVEVLCQGPCLNRPLGYYEPSNRPSRHSAENIVFSIALDAQVSKRAEFCGVNERHVF
jgi:hypothetical protein